MRDRLRKLRELLWPSGPPALTYSESVRCPCGAGLAYRHKDTSWDCSEILLGTADPLCLHTDRLPFAFYEIKSERRGRGSTRPDG